MNSIYFLRDTNSAEQRLFCFTEEQKNNIVREGKVSEKDFHKATTFEEINDCIKMKQKVMSERTRQKSYFHPTCSITRKNILKKLVEYTNNNVLLTSVDIDIQFGGILNTKKYGEIYTTHINKEFQTIWGNFWTEDWMKNKRDFTLILKASDNFEGIIHTFTIFIDIYIDDNDKPYIDEICIVDTAQTPIVPKLFAKTIAIKLGIPFDGEINFMFEKSEFIKYRMGLQEEEKKMDMRGYCGAWSLYFIYNFIRFENSNRDTKKILKEIYKYLVTRKNVLTSLIIYWWDTIVSQHEIKAKDWQKIPELKNVLPSDDIIPDIDYEMYDF